ncbi:MAG: protein kinase [Gemmatimonadota bacterium]|nr:protein kinase [Gemmatimonadota bacterium]
MTAPSELLSRLQVALGAQYRIERELGHGGMGRVFLARDTTLDRPVAIKVVHPELAIHSSITERFLAEARMIARLRHPSIVAVHAAGESTGLFYYVMDYVPGMSLRQRLLRDGQLPVAEVNRVLLDLADALHAAGTAGLVHRDVKPENILLDDATGRVMLADFGIARAMAGENIGTRTGEGIAVGTPTYMSPEQSAGDTVDARSDLYALGVVAYEMLAGRPPFRASTAAAVASMHLAEVPTPITALRRETPAALAHTVMRALEKDPATRWQSGADMRATLIGAAPLPAPRAPATRRRWFVGAGAAMLLAVAVVAVRPNGPAAGVNPRHSLLVLPFTNVRADPAVAWLRDGSVSMLALNLSQWRDLVVVDHERLHDLLARRRLDGESAIGLSMARQLARDAGVWTVVLGEYTRIGDSLQLVARVYDVTSGARIEAAQIAGRSGDDVRPLFDRLAAQLLNLSGAPSGVTANLAASTTASLEAYRTYLGGIEKLSRWNLAGAEQSLRHAVALDSTFGLAYYKLSLTRGWIAGAGDSIGIAAIHRATKFADRLPEHDRAMIEAYRLFLEGDFARGQAAYRRLLSKDSTDADAWYGLGDVNFHDPAMATMGGRYSTSLRSFKRAIALDPGYYLAYEHIAQIYRWAAEDRPFIALLPGDSLVQRSMAGTDAGKPAGAEAGRYPGLDSLRLAAAIRRAREDGIASAREWLAHQPDNIHAQNALIYSLSTGKQYDAALREIDRLARSAGGSTRPDLPFVRARVLMQQGSYQEAARAVAVAVDSLKPEQFDGGRLPFETVEEITSGANVLGWAGQVTRARRAMDLSAEVRAAWFPEATGSRPFHGSTLLGQLYRSHLYTALGAPGPVLRQIWTTIADSARNTPRGTRSSIAHYGWAAAVGMFLQNPADPAPLDELQALDGGKTPPELRALGALTRGDSAQARQLLQLPDSAVDKAYYSRPQWWGFRMLIAANTWHELGDDVRALKVLEGFDPARFSSQGPDIRWLLLGQARLLRGEILEAQGRNALAREEYRGALQQWEDADSTFAPLIARVRSRLAQVEGAG